MFVILYAISYNINYKNKNIKRKTKNERQEPKENGYCLDTRLPKVYQQFSSVRHNMRILIEFREPLIQFIKKYKRII